MALSRRAYVQICEADSWKEIWEAGPYYKRLSNVLENADRTIALVGWQIDSRLMMGGNETLKQKLLRLCELKPGLHIYLLMWDHAYFYLMEREWWQGRQWEGLHPRLHFIFDNRHPFGGSHHEKIGLIDGERAFCGGIDLCDDRWDTPHHSYEDPRRSLAGLGEKHGPYHDLTVELTGPVCQAIQRHIARRWRKISAIPFPWPKRLPVRPMNDKGKSAPRSVYLSRTLAHLDAGAQSKARAFGVSRTHVTREIEFLFRDLIREARHLLLFEGQYYWSPEVNDLLIAQMLERRGTGFKIVMVLANLVNGASPTRKMTPYELRLMEKLEAAAEFTGTTLTIVYPQSFPPLRSPRPTAMCEPKRIYVHSKVLIVDDRYLSIGSANLAMRALRLDTELHLTLEGRERRDRAHIRRFTRKLLNHWNLREPARGAGNLREPARGAGNLREPARGAGNLREPARGAGNLREPARGAGNLREPARGAGNLGAFGSGPPSFHSLIHAQAVRPRLLRLERRKDRVAAQPPNIFETWIPWHLFFDPFIPWLFPLKRLTARWIIRSHARLHTHLPVPLAVPLEASTMLCFTSAGAAWLTSTGAQDPVPVAAFSAILSTCWILPVPFAAGTVLAALTMSANDASRAAAGSFWIAALCAYLMGRAYPPSLYRILHRFYSEAEIGRGRRWMGRRSFGAVVRTLFDPRIPVSLKLGLQGLYSVPLPWFLLGAGLLLPSFFVDWIRLWSFVSIRKEGWGREGWAFCAITVLAAATAWRSLRRPLHK